MTTAGRAPGRGGYGLLEQLMAVVRPEFRTEIYIPAPDDPVFAAGKCTVAGCDRTAVQRGLCNGHVIRWRQRGRPAVEDFLADSGPPVRGRSPWRPAKWTAAVTAAGRRAVLQAPRPVGPGWHARSSHLDRAGAGRAGRSATGCRLPFCTLWTENPAKIFCRNHQDRWQRQGRPDLARFIVDCSSPARPIDLRGLGPQLRLEFQYALQCRRDEPAPHRRHRAWSCQAVRQARTAGRVLAAGPPGAAMAAGIAGSRIRAAGACSCWTPATPSSPCGTGPAGRSSTPATCGGCTSCPASPPRRPALPRARLRFDRITQPWLRDLGKRWMRLRLTSGLSITAAKAGLDALACSASSSPSPASTGSPGSTVRCWNATWPG